MRKTLLSIIVAGVSLTVGAQAARAEYLWTVYNGHEYALTQNYGSWLQAESEAVFQGGHLVTINNANENAFVTFFSKDSYSPGGSTGDWNGVWIGYRNEGGVWGWASGEPVTYTNCFSLWDRYVGDHTYFHGGSHPYAGTWNHAWQHDNAALGFRGVIERTATVPEPSAVIRWLSLGAVGAVVAWRWRRRKAA